MKRRTQKTNSFINMMFGGVLLVAAMAGAAVFGGQDASAKLEYSTTADVSFTINPSITISVSDDLTIDELAPGNYADSNEITVGVVTNSTSGYVLQATVGTSTTNNQLVNSDNSAYYFSSLATNASIASMGDADASTWGYAYSTNAGNTWSNYSGLPQDANSTASERGKGGKSLIDTNTALDGKTVKFKIGAKAAPAQALGDYTNTINFYAVTK